MLRRVFSGTKWGAQDAHEHPEDGFGGVYRLEGPPFPAGRFDDDAAYVLGVWMLRNDVQSYEVVSEQALRGE